MAATAHVAPLCDLIAHETGSDEPDCVCGPSTVPVAFDNGLTAWMIVHHSLDGRELDEEA